MSGTRRHNEDPVINIAEELEQGRVGVGFLVGRGTAQAIAGSILGVSIKPIAPLEVRRVV